jgi:hypothetical protein
MQEKLFYIALCKKTGFHPFNVNNRIDAGRSNGDGKDIPQENWIDPL